MLLDQRVELKDRVAAKELHNLLSDIRNKKIYKFVILMYLF